MQCCTIGLLGFLACLANLHIVTSQPADCVYLKSIIPQCGCEGVDENSNDIIINCRLKGLTSMPLINGSYSGTIYEFTLAINKIETLPSNAFQGLKIQRLDISQNNIKNVSETAFQGLADTLIILKLGGDVTSPITAPFTAISSLINLEELTLNHFRVPSNNLESVTYFQPFSKLQTLSLDNWNLVSIGTDAFTGLTSLVKLHLANHPSLVTFPVPAVNRLKDTLVEIEITGTGITNLTYFGFQALQQLKTLKLRQNELKYLEDHCFEGLETRLEYLDLSFNSVGSQLGRIQPLQGLKTLLLQTTGLSLPTNPIFLQNKPNLKSLNLASNNLFNIASNTFANLASLNTLDLSDNQIAIMADDSLNGLTSLEKLLLDHQAIPGRTLTLPSLFTLTSIKTLMLASTPLSMASWDTISQATSLQSLNMRQTFSNLGKVPDLIFNRMKSLTTVDLSSNGISSISQESFAGPNATLNNIHLSSNKITYFDSCTFHEYAFPIELDLIQNPLHCDCTLYWLRKAVADGDVQLTTYEECILPLNLNGTRFTQNDLPAFCIAPPTIPVCATYFTSTVPPVGPETSSKLPPVNINVNIVGSTSNAITVSWVIDALDKLQYIVVLYSELQSSQNPIPSRQLPSTNSQYDVTGLKSDTGYEICVEGNRFGGGKVHECVSSRTKPSGLEPSTTPATGSDGPAEIGIIIGAVVGGLVLFAILVAIIYLLVIRKRSPKEKYPVQPRTFTAAELPSVGYDSKRYRRKKKDDKTDGNRNNVSVTVISDGQTSQPNVGRASTGSYQYLNNQPVNGQPNPSTLYVNDGVTNQTFSPYDNDQTLRPLPQMPNDSQPSSGGYYNPSFRNSTDIDQQPHTYTEIKI